jgi:hypothetical protein
MGETSRTRPGKAGVALFGQVEVIIKGGKVQPVDTILVTPGSLVIWKIKNDTDDPQTVKFKDFHLQADDSSTAKRTSFEHPLEGDVNPATKLRKRKKPGVPRVTFVAASIKDDLASATYKYDITIGSHTLDPEIIVF